MFPLSADIEVLIPIHSRAESHTAGVLAWFEKHFQMMGATVERHGPGSLVVELESEYIGERVPGALRTVRRLAIEIRPSAYGLTAYFEVHYHWLRALLSLGAGALGAAFFPFGGSIAPAIVGLSFAFGPPLLIQARVAQALHDLGRDVADSYLGTQVPRVAPARDESTA